MKSKSLSEILRDEYSLDFKSLRWISKGGEILKYINSPVVLVDFKKDSNNNWTSETKMAEITSINDWDGITLTYKIKYTIEKESFEGRIVPEGFIFNNPEEDKWAKRFVPYSLHMKMTEEENFFKRLMKLYETKDTMPVDQINQLRSNKDGLSYYNYIAAVIDTKDGINCGLCSFRIHEITMPNFSKKDNTWMFGVKDESGNYYPLKWCKDNNYLTLYSGGKFIGNVKILDVED